VEAGLEPGHSAKLIFRAGLRFTLSPEGSGQRAHQVLGRARVLGGGGHLSPAFAAPVE
jgi:hypothetical protein